ncbi:hypothetical protein [Sphingomonas bacterium]|uniref:hypothetical protein n=1 Tax=Sphingomonas bacterium TaxID=1895847 RepID=UPI001576E2BF|nr:hypothetical protein [Sphingomonas bacterium]
MKSYLHALRLLEQASDLVEKDGDTLVVAHLAMPISLIRERLAQIGPQVDMAEPG